ncbi:olfactory receptor 13A1-like [Lynx canadensis]|uniref:olfactory receptor 13A1-like n=1 Tax=Lynx canadensis TaxID=61383 RepID=UPI0011B08A57|nr:olfactory receptor 13A1-like [Lynx canadensis]
MSNQMLVTQFPLQGFSEVPPFQALLFILFLCLYAVALCGHSLLVVAITLSSRLHTPMYFFLANLSVLALVCTCTMVPKGSWWRRRGASPTGAAWPCMVVGGGRGGAALHRRGLRPLHGHLSTTALWLHDDPQGVCGAGWSCVGIGMLGAGVNACLMSRRTFRGPYVIGHVFCGIPPLLLLSCSSTYVNNIMAIIADVFFAVLNFLLTMVSYGFIMSTILRVRTAKGKQRAFSTCSSHLIAATLYYSTIIYTYLSPGSSHSPGTGKVVAVLYSTVSPTLNPLIYSLRNKDIKAALRKVLMHMAKNL